MQNIQKLFSLEKRAFAVFALLFFNLLSSQIYISEGTTIYTDSENAISSTNDNKYSDHSEGTIYVTSSAKIIDFSGRSSESSNSDPKLAIEKKQNQKAKNQKLLITKAESQKNKQKTVRETPTAEHYYIPSKNTDTYFGISKYQTSSVVPLSLLKLKFTLFTNRYNVPDFSYKSQKTFYSYSSILLNSGQKRSFRVRPPPFQC